MAHHAPQPELTEADLKPIGEGGWPVFWVALVAGIGGLLAGALFALGADDPLARFAFSYLVAYGFFLGITLGMVFFTIITQLFRAGWCVAFRRVPEAFAANMTTMLLLALPILGVVAYDGAVRAAAEPGVATTSHLYIWNRAFDGGHHGAEHHDAHDGDHAEPGQAEPGHADPAHAEPHADPEHHSALPGTSLPATAAFDPDASTPTADPDPAPADPAHAEHHEVDPGGAYLDPADRPSGQAALAIQRADFLDISGALVDPHGDGAGKRPWLNAGFWTIRILAYLGILTGIGVYYHRKSVAQDADGDPKHTLDREGKAPWVVLLFAMSLTYLAFDLLMSVDPGWYSTIFGVYYFAGSFLAAVCVMVLTVLVLQRTGKLRIVSVEHYHDLGKLMFAFVFFWGYIAFSQYMLIWYASLPETTYWFEMRGASLAGVDRPYVVPQDGSVWSYLAMLLLFGKLLVPFLFLLSRHVKRNLKLLSAAAVWLLLMQYADLYWVIMPVYSLTTEGASAGPPWPLVEIATFLGVGGVMLAGFVNRFRQSAPIPHRDPRLFESMMLETAANAPLHPPGASVRHPSPSGP
ncbi:MAG: hypothetical protein AAF288_10800 [Planctomycetota bacterium]